MPEEDKAQNRYHAAGNTEYQAALRELETKQQQKPSYAGSYDDLVEESFGKLHNRQPFAYDPGSDLLYQQYRDQYLTSGRRAMNDSMARAASLTGGYGSSYAAALGQQHYGQYLQQLNERLPELYDRAYSRWLDEGQALLHGSHARRLVPVPAVMAHQLRQDAELPAPVPGLLGKLPVTAEESLCLLLPPGVIKFVQFPDHLRHGKAGIPAHLHAPFLI